ncbi:MAG: PDDEXK nuclease domain-containing protein [Chitinispirillales bacterium]|jgi:predicted nuclease of restriction endonuclease-like (RecB) superfamily|nr:PDDEXK nuclease domain-containing protein [Chitinispirillales bacterium]
MSVKKTTISNNVQVNEDTLFKRVSEIIENRKAHAGFYANREITLMYWEIGQYINTIVLESQRAEYGKRILSALGLQLTAKYGRAFTERNLYRMTLFAERFPDKEILPPLAAKLSWSHIIELLPLKTDAARMYYANDAAVRKYGAKELRYQISRKAYERQEIANTRLSQDSSVPFNVFKDPYLLDTLDLKENFLEADLEKAILTELEKFILEFGHGFTFVERQKRMIIDDEDIVLDLLFYHRKLKRLVAVELKVGVFKAAYKGQMELYLKWLDRYEREEGEETPIGIILCATANRKKIELLEMDKTGIAVAEYWTDLLPKNKLETKIKTILIEARERLERRKSLPKSKVQKQLDYFFEPKDEEEN